MIIIAVIINSGVDLPARSRLELSVQTQIQMNLWLPVNTHTLTHTLTLSTSWGGGGERAKQPAHLPSEEKCFVKNNKLII